ncbi:protocatechuate 3,4-dioxygenase subunit alpha [Roseibacterium sp. SDUM158017]|uniref:protocatechuate 3,4-dioxygenase subunit alpha n=1 Tax=Roseicyclus salinarum TaxID=3036773 RepID=UPI0024158A55|nr:protocatechuate 3,4-dioxygenase subunit alpha [Roseibacterium sp. SDUM158017]MDG4648759.1 protocatechuate 3,4-dioxygenase subunit alpha [Roseibacterium sp. SDUM158017]
MAQNLDLLQETASQTAGPYVHIGCIPSFAGIEGLYPEDLGASPIREGARGEIVTIRGAVFDGTGWALRDALIESWQPDAGGLFPGEPGADPAVTGFCRFAADGQTGEFTLRTVRPGPVALRDGRIQAPHVSLWIVARGINVGLQTRIYFEDEDNAADPLLCRIEHRPRVETLIAKRTGAGEFRFDILLQGEGETVFLDL